MGLFGGGDRIDYQPIEVPDYWVNPRFGRIQDYLEGYGTDILQGDIVDYFRPIGEWGSDQFEDVLSLTNRDIGQMVMSAQAQRGGRRGATDAAMAKAIADNSRKMRYADFMRGLQGRESLLKLGAGLTGDVRDRAFQYQQDRSDYQLGKARIEEAGNQYAFGVQEARENAKDKAIAKILSAGIGAAGTIFAGPLGGMLAGTASKAALGSAAGKTGKER